VTLVLIAMLGISAATIWVPTFPSGAAVQVQNTQISFNESISVEQSVQGQGYAMQYMYAKAGNTELKEYGHGSGSLDQETLLSTWHLNKTNHLPQADYNDFDQDCILFRQTVNSWTYAPFNTVIGTGFYGQPVNYVSLLKEKTWIKNRVAGSSIQNEIEYAHAMKKDISALVVSKRNLTYDPVYDSYGLTQLKINEDVTDGRIHIGALQASSENPNPWVYKGMLWPAWRNPDLEIDEDFVGTYHVTKNITISKPYSYVKPAYDWLPCCGSSTDTLGSGWASMTTGDKRGFGASVKGIFDCTCYKWPLAAQFPETH
jgi:hypothetical protein